VYTDVDSTQGAVCRYVKLSSTSWLSDSIITIMVIMLSDDQGEQGAVGWGCRSLFGV